MQSRNTSQSTQHLLMIEPAVFYANPETMETNAYQTAEKQPIETITAQALTEYRNFRDKLTEKGVIITQARGFDKCPDMVFPNCMSTHSSGRMYLYPMLNKNRRAEHSQDLIDILGQAYPDIRDWRHYADQNLHLESTASICRDRVNMVGYSALSPRTNKDLALKWMDEMEYEPILFETQSHAGIPVYHTDCTMWIGSTLAAVCTPCIKEKDQGTVLKALRRYHDVIELSMEQLRAFCGNALEVRGYNNKRYLAISSGALEALTDTQITLIEKHMDGIIHSDLQTLETYGGGSARCMLMELF